MIRVIKIDTNIIRLLQTLKDFTPELQELSDEELYDFWRLWMEQGHKGTLKDFVEEQKVLS